MNRLPAGTVTLLFTDIEGSTALLRSLGRETYVQALSAHRRLLREAMNAHAGVEVEMQGDSFFFAFSSAQEAVKAAAEAQRAIADHIEETKSIKVRIGIHTGEPTVTEENLYAGLDVHRAQRVMSVGWGGEILMSARTTDLVRDELPPGLQARELGRYRLKDFDQPEPLAQLVVEGIPATFPRPRAPRVRPLPRSRRARAAVAVGVLAAAGAVVAALLLTRSTPPAVANTVAAVDPGRNSVAKRIPVGTSPTSITAGEGGVWVVNAADSTLTELSPSGEVVRTIGTSGVPTGVTTTAGAVWVADRPATLLRLDPASGDVVGRVRLKLPRTGFGADLWLTAGRGFVWATAQNRLVRVDPGSMRVRLTALPPPDWGPLAIAPDAIWVSQFAALYHLGPQGRPVIASFNVAQGPLVVAARYVWVLNPAVDAVTQIDPRTGTFVRTIPVGHDPSAIAYGSGSLWVASRNGTVTRIDPDMGRVLATVSVGGTPEGIAVGYGRVWVSVN